MVFYRKYRPQAIEELDSAEVREKLFAVLSVSESVPHAFLFTGPKGLGKTSTARIVAKAVNCEKNQELRIKNQEKKQKKEKIHDSSFVIHDSQGIEPCNKCEQCISIAHGTNMDVLEIDGASNRGIDEVRDLREKIGLAPIRAAKKVYIIDEVHMLTTEAFNALLKTLEEPPAHALFILCTTEPQKVPATIVSRCFSITFKRAKDEELLRSLSRIIQGEKIGIEKEAMSLIASLSDGSFRDAAKILEEMVTLSGEKKITKELLEGKYHTSNISKHIDSLLTFLEVKDAKSSLALIKTISDEDTDIAYFVDALIGTLHTLLLCHFEVIPFEGKTQLTVEEIKKLFNLLAQARSQMRYAVLPQLPLELAVIEYTQAQKNAEPYTEKHAEVGGTSNVPAAFDGGVVPRIVSRSSAPVSDKTSQKQNLDDNSKGVLTKLIDAVKQQNHSLAGVLRGCSLENFDGKTLSIKTAFKFHKERLDDKKAMAILEEVAQDVVGEKVAVSIILVSKSA